MRKGSVSNQNQKGKKDLKYLPNRNLITIYSTTIYRNNRNNNGNSRSNTNNFISSTLACNTAKNGGSDKDSPIKNRNNIKELIEHHFLYQQPQYCSNSLSNPNDVKKHRSRLGCNNKTKSPNESFKVYLFSNSNCYDSPAPSALPRPPQQWTSSDADFEPQKKACSTGRLCTGAEIDLECKNYRMLDINKCIN